MYKIIVYLVLGFGLILGYIKYIELKGIFYPDKNIEFTPAWINLSFEDVYIQTEDKVKINAWFIHQNNAKYTLLFCHGNAGNIGHRLDKLLLLKDIGLNVFIIDYRGYGKSQGRPSENGLYLDAQAGYDYLVKTRHIVPEQIILYGESLGTAVVIDLASKAEIKGLIIEGSFSCGRDVAKSIYSILPSFLFSNQFNSLAKIKGVTAPKLFIHSANDEIIPLDLAKKLYRVTPEPKYFVEINGDHNNAFLDSREKYTSSISAFMERLLPD